GLMREIQDAVSLARHVAIHENLITTVCRSDDGLRCQGDWMDGSIVFTDANANHVLDGEDRLLHRREASTLPGTLLFRAFGNRQHLQFDGRGLTRFQNGNFTYCPSDGDRRLIRQLILSFSGRTRMAWDANGDGVVENSQGEAVSCAGWGSPELPAGSGSFQAVGTGGGKGDGHRVTGRVAGLVPDGIGNDGVGVPARRTGLYAQAVPALGTGVRGLHGTGSGIGAAGVGGTNGLRVEGTAATKLLLRHLHGEGGSNTVGTSRP